MIKLINISLVIISHPKKFFNFKLCQFILSFMINQDVLKLKFFSKNEFRIYKITRIIFIGHDLLESYVILKFTHLVYNLV